MQGLKLINQAEMELFYDSENKMFSRYFKEFPTADDERVMYYILDKECMHPYADKLAVIFGTKKFDLYIDPEKNGINFLFANTPEGVFMIACK